ncbi:MAG: sulfatase-like hydrolase/transferase [Planctomycetes bacterium]|nr:sulfatase-like hydrolase/transferase [Planctomycetota bacterium]
MRTSFLRACWWLAAGSGLGALAGAWSGFGAGDLPRAFVITWLGAGMGAAPLAVVLLPPPPRPGPDRCVGPLLARLACRLAPLLTGLGAPMGGCAAAAWIAGATALLALRGPVPAARPARLLPVLWLLLAAAGLWSGWRQGPAPVDRGFPERSGAAPQGPDVLLISIDTLRADALAGPRPPGYELPTFDRLRREGTSAPFALSSSGLTLPGHLSMLTGLDSLEHGVRGNFDRVPAGRLEFLSERFHAAGYRTAAVIANGLLARDIGFGDGFEVYDDSDVPRLGPIRRFLGRLEGRSWLGLVLNHHRYERVVSFALFRAYRAGNGLPERGRGERTNRLAVGLLEPLLADPRPFFFFLHYMDPHDPYGTVAPFAGSLTAGLPPLPGRLAVDPAHGISGFAAIALEEDLRSGDPARAAAAAAPVRHLHQAYLEEVAFVDRKVGEILALLERGGRPTIVLLTGDHGEHFGEHGLMKHGNSLYEELLRVPFILTGPGVPAGAQLSGDAQLIDVVPTLLSLSGLAVPEGLRGRALVRGGGFAPAGARQHLAADDERFSLRLGAEKWIGDWSFAGPDPFVATGFFELGADPGEVRNLIGAAPEAWPRAVRAELQRDQHQRGAESDEAQRFRAEELGYADAGEAN